MSTAQPPQSLAKLEMSLMQTSLVLLGFEVAHSVMLLAQLPQAERMSPLPNLQERSPALMLASYPFTETLAKATDAKAAARTRALYMVIRVE